MGFRNKIAVVCVGVILSFPAFTQSVLENYIQTGLKNNPGIREKEASTKQMESLLRQNRSYFMPSAGINARYSVAGGGRTIEFPIGDLMNPVYEGLTGLYQLHGIPVTAPSPLQNEEFPFLRPTEQETKLRIVQPLYNPDILINYKISEKKLEVAKLELQWAKRELVKKIKVAYYQYLEASELLSMLNSAKSLVNENLRVANSLYKNEKATIDRVYRAEAELKNFELKIADAGNKVNLARAYFNTLLNRETSADIETEIVNGPVNPQTIPDTDSLISLAEGQREELLVLKVYTRINDLGTSMYRMKKTPRVNAVLDYGFQGEKYTFTNEDDYYMASVIFSWDIFNGFRNRNKIAESRYLADAIGYKYEAARQNIRLEVINAVQEYSSAELKWNASLAAEKAAESNYKIVEKKYLNEMASHLEKLDALTTLVSAKSRRIISYYETKAYYAGIERVACIYPLNDLI